MSISDKISIIIALVIYLGIIVTFIAIGLKWSRSKGLSLIAGYNTASENEKNKYDIIRLTRFMSKIAYCDAVLLISLVPIIYLSVKWKVMWLLYFFILAIVVFNVYGAIYSNKIKYKNYML